MNPGERELSEYLDDIREIRATMLRAENRLHVPAWFFFAMAALIGTGAIAHALVAVLPGVSLVTALVAIWLPVFLLAAVAEVAAWVQKGRREGLPWLSRSFGRFLATISGIMTAVTAVGIALVAYGHSPAGVLLLVATCVFLGYAPYSPSASIWTGWALLPPGLALLIVDARGIAATLVAAGLIVAGFLVCGVAELRSRTPDG